MLVTNQIDTAQPLDKIAKSISEDLRRTHPVTDLFCRQWKIYVETLYAACSVEAHQRRAIDPRWFEKQVERITFKDVFHNPLWRKADQNVGQPLDTLAENATVVKRRPEEMLAVSECIRGASVIDTGRIMDHVGHRLELARTQAYIARLRDWDLKTLQPLLQQQATFALVDPKPLLSPRSAHEALREQVEERLEKLRKLSEADLKEAFEVHLPKVGQQFVKDHTADLLAKEKQFETKIRHSLQRVLITSWCSQVLNHWTINTTRLSSKPVQDILQEEEAPTAKRVRLFQQQEKGEQKHAAVVGKGILQDIVNVLSATPAAAAADLDRLLHDTLEAQVLPILQRHLASNSSGNTDIVAEREALGQEAVLADLGHFMVDLGDRGKLNPLVIHQQQQLQLKTPAIDQLINEYEKARVDQALHDTAACRLGFQEIHVQLLAHLRKAIEEPVKTKLAHLQAHLTELRERVIVAEPWFDTTVISAELRRDLPAAGGEEVGTVSQALNKAQAWFGAALTQ